MFHTGHLVSQWTVRIFCQTFFDQMQQNLGFLPLRLLLLHLLPLNLFPCILIAFSSFAIASFPGKMQQNIFSDRMKYFSG